MIPVRLSRDAANYVRREAEYLRHHSPAAARKFSQAVKEARELLRTFPQVGNHMHGLQISGNRTLVVGDYLLDYFLRRRSNRGHVHPPWPHRRTNS